MRRTDRLFEIIQLFRGGRLWRGAEIAEKLEVSLRTIYRDIDTLIASGVPIEGARGVGYLLRAPIFLPPLTLTSTELEALHLGMEIVRQIPDDELSVSAVRLLEKINAVVPDERPGSGYLENLSVYSTNAGPTLSFLAMIRHAIKAQECLDITYTKPGGKTGVRRIRPLHVEFWGQVWTCTGWCELRRDFRVFRVDRMQSCVNSRTCFSSKPGQTYQDYLAGISLD